jgi:hypothetical protein
MPRFDDLIGKKLIVAIVHSETGSYTVTLLGHEPGGLWVESPDFHELTGGREFLLPRRKGDPPQKNVFFLPFAQILFLVAPETDLGR